MNHYPQGSLVQFQNIFRDINGFAVDPTAVTFALKVGQNPSSAPITYTSATTPAVGTIARTGVGRYCTWGDTTSISGPLVGKWTSTGAGQAEVEDCVYIDPAAF
jgi:hypothetical protein